MRTVRDALYRAVKAAPEAQGDTHLLRHSFATHVLDLRHDPRLIQMLLGLSTFRSTQRYTQLRAECLRRIKGRFDRLCSRSARRPFGTRFDQFWNGLSISGRRLLRAGCSATVALEGKGNPESILEALDLDDVVHADIDRAARLPQPQLG